MDYIGIIEKSIYNIDSKICGIIDDYLILQDSQKVADYVIQFLRTYLEHIAARIYAGENPNEEVVIRGRDKWYTKYMKFLKEHNEYGYIWDVHSSLQITTSHYVPEEDGAVRLMEFYLSRLYQLRNQMNEKYGMRLLKNLEKYPQEEDSELNPYYEQIYGAISHINIRNSLDHTNYRYYITRKKYRSVNGKGFFEYTLSYAQENITKFDRFVAYSLMDIPDNYSIQCDFSSTNVSFNGIDIDITCISAWNISIRPCELEKLAAICGYEIKIKSDSALYNSLMKFLSRTGMNLLDIILADDEEYAYYMNETRLNSKLEIEKTFNSIRDGIINQKNGSNILRYLLCYLKNDIIRDQLSDRPNNWISNFYIKNEALPFDEMPYATALSGHNIPKSKLYKCIDMRACAHQHVAAMMNKEAYDSNMLYVPVNKDKIEYYSFEKDIFNDALPNTHKQQLRKIELFDNNLFIQNYYETTKKIITILKNFSAEGFEIFEEILSENSDYCTNIDDDSKKEIVYNIFMNSRVGLVYGAAGTGKTRIAEYISKLFEGKNILLLANTNTATNNLKRRIDVDCDCQTIYDYLKHGYSWKNYDLVIVDECSTVCNEDILQLFDKCNTKVYLLLGDVYQIEAIKFGNWFNFARYFVDKKSVYELTTPYRAKDKHNLLNMWKYVREFDTNMFERLQANGYISTLDETIFENNEDEIVLCLGYDGLYGINNINRYMQKINPSAPVYWGNWTYKVGDKILFSENRRFGNILYNNLKGEILSIDKQAEQIKFRIMVERNMTKLEANIAGVDLIECCHDNRSIIEFKVKKRVERDSDSDYSEEVIPFQIAYAISIHKAQGLEYKSVKVVITEDVDERISHNIFYTAITRTTDKLKIYMSKGTQKKLAEKFVKSNVGLQQAQLFAGHTGMKLKNSLTK